MKLRQLISFLITLAFRFGQKIKNFQINPNLKIKLGTKPGFSLVELSIVVLIIGGMTGSLVGANNMVKRSRLVKAKSETASSPVKNMDGLALWYEAVMEESIDTANNATNISIWHDLGPNKKNALATSGNQPQYIDSAINKLPAIRFDGNDFMSFTGNALANSNYTVIVVEQRRDSRNNNYFLGGTGNTTNSNLYLGYQDNTHIIHGQTGNDYLINTASYGFFSTPKIHIFTHNSNSNNGKKYYQNTGYLGSGSETSPASLVSYSGSRIGGTTSGLYYGDIGEIIIFNRTLSNTERNNIESYLAKKWYINNQPGSVPVNTNLCNVTTAGVVSPNQVNNAGGTLYCTGANFVSNSPVTYTCSGSPSGVFSSSPTNCPCIATYTLVGSVCQPTCPVNGVTGIGNTTVNGTAGNTLSCNQPGYSTSDSVSYTCLGGSFVITGGTSCDTCTGSYDYISGQCRQRCNVSGQNGVNNTTVSYTASTANLYCNQIGYNTSDYIAYTCTGGVFSPTGGSYCDTCTGSYDYISEQCRPRCNVSGQNGVNNTTVSYTASTANLYCNQIGYNTSDYIAYTCTGGVFSPTGGSYCDTCTGTYTYGGGICGDRCYISGVTGVANGYIDHNPPGGLLTCSASGYSGTINYTCNNGSSTTSGICSQINCSVSVTGSATSSVPYGSTSVSCNQPGYAGSFSFGSCTGSAISGSCTSCASGYSWDGSGCRANCNTNLSFPPDINVNADGGGDGEYFTVSTIYGWQHNQVVSFSAISDYGDYISGDCHVWNFSAKCNNGSLTWNQEVNVDLRNGSPACGYRIWNWNRNSWGPTYDSSHETQVIIHTSGTVYLWNNTDWAYGSYTNYNNISNQTYSIHITP